MAVSNRGNASSVKQDKVWQVQEVGRTLLKVMQGVLDGSVPTKRAREASSAARGALKATEIRLEHGNVDV